MQESKRVKAENKATKPSAVKWILFFFLLWFIGYFLFVLENWKEKATMWLLRK